MNTDMVKKYKTRKEKADAIVNDFFEETPYWKKAFDNTHYTSLRYFYKKILNKYSTYNILCEALWNYSQSYDKENILEDDFIKWIGSEISRLIK